MDCITFKDFVLIFTLTLVTVLGTCLGSAVHGPHGGSYGGPHGAHGGVHGVHGGYSYNTAHYHQGYGKSVKHSNYGGHGNSFHGVGNGNYGHGAGYGHGASHSYGGGFGGYYTAGFQTGPYGAIAIYSNSDRQRGVNKIADHVGAGTGTARWYGVPGADGGTIANGGFYKEPGKKQSHYGGYH